MGLPDHLTQGNYEIDQLLIGNVVKKPSELNKKHHINSKCLKKNVE